MHRTENIKEFAVIGYPLDQSMSPILHNEVFNQLNINATYRKIEISKKYRAPIFVIPGPLGAFN